MRETWYVLEDGSVADPSECATDEKGLNLTHKSGVKVAMKGEVPHSRGVDVDPDRKAASDSAPPKPAAKVAKAPANRELKPKKPAAKKKPGYETR